MKSRNCFDENMEAPTGIATKMLNRFGASDFATVRYGGGDYVNQRSKKKAQFNRGKIGKIPKQYENITWALNYRGKALYKVLLRLYRYVETLDCRSVHNRDLFWMSGDYARSMLHSGKAVEYLNYLCCVGFIDKVNPGFTAPQDQPQWMTFTNDPDESGQTFGGIQAQVSAQMRKAREDRKEKEKKKGDRQRKYCEAPVNLYVIPKLTEERLTWINQQIGVYREKKIFFSSISADVLKQEGLYFDLKRVYLRKVSDKTLDEKIKNWEKISFIAGLFTDQQGYCYKDDVRKSLKSTLTEYQFDLLWRFFLVQGRSEFTYHPPKKSDKELYNLSSGKWIVQRRSSG